MEIIQLLCSRSYCPANIPQLLCSSNWRSSHTKFLVFASLADIKLTLLEVEISRSYVTSDGQSASLSWNKAPIWGLRPDFYYYLSVAVLFMWGVLSDERTGSCLQLLLVSPAQPFSGQSPVGLPTIFYCLRFETSLFVDSYDSQGYGGGIRPPPPHGTTGRLVFTRYNPMTRTA
jgi:hypothetical protein